MEELGQLLFQIAMGIGLAACAGLRAFLPLFVVSLAGKLEWIPLADRFDWLATWPAVTVFGIAVVTELLADKVPWLDNLLDWLQGWVKLVAGAMLAMAVLSELSPLEATVLGIITGTSTAGVVHLLKAKIRLLSSAVTAGIGNPILSLGEDAVALAGSVASLVFPFVIVVLVVLSLVLVYLAFRRVRLRVAS